MSESTENPPLKERDNDVEVVKTPTKRTPSKRLSYLERSKKESEELIKNMGGTLDVEGGRRTRSSTRGTSAPATPLTPPPAKKPRANTPRRNRAKKGEEEPEETKTSPLADDPVSSTELSETAGKQDLKTEKIVQNNTSENESTTDNSAIEEKVEGLGKKTFTDDRTIEKILINNAEKLKEHKNDEEIGKNSTISPLTAVTEEESTNSPSEKKESIGQSYSPNKVTTEEIPTKPQSSTIEHEKRTILPEAKTLDSVEPMEVDSTEFKLELSSTVSNKKGNESEKSESVESKPPATATTAETTATTTAETTGTTIEEKCSPATVPVTENNTTDSPNSCTKQNTDISAINSGSLSKEKLLSSATVTGVENPLKESPSFSSDNMKTTKISETKIEINNVKSSDELKLIGNENLLLGAEVQVHPEKQNNHQ